MSAQREAAYVWELPVRLTHWLIVLSIIVLATTGIYIGNPFLVVPGEARFHFVTGTVKAIHFWAAIVFTCSVVARLAWMFLGNRWARWDQFLPVRPERIRELPRVLAFYTFLRRKPPETTGHNPLAGAIYTAVIFLYLVSIATGLAMYSASASIESPLRGFTFLIPLFGGLQLARWIHHVVMWLILGFAVHHIASAVMVAIVERNGTIESIFSGYKFPERPAAEREPGR